MKKKKDKEKVCNYKGKESECPEKTVKKCKVSESECPKRKEYNERKQSDKSIPRTWILILAALLAIAISIIITIICDKDSCFANTVANIFQGGAVSCIAGVIITWVIDIRARMNEYETSFLNALSSNRYVRQLSKPQLLQLRQDVTKAIHHKNSPNMADGLIHLDNDICQLLEMVYCNKYRQTITCKDDTQMPGMVRKKNIIEYELVNPHQEEENELITYHNLFKKANDNDAIKKYFPEFELTLFKKDNEDDAYTEITDDSVKNYELKEGKKPNPDKEFYNASVYMARKESTEEGIKVSFKYKLKVSISFTIIVPADDICFTKRLKHPAHNFRIDYFYDSDNVKLYGQLFGTNIEQSEVTVTNVSDNKISLETSEWMLPRDGAIVVVTHKPNKN